MVLEYHRQRFTTYKNHVRRHWPGVDPYPITADKLLRLINDKKDTMGLIALRNLIYSQKKHPSHGPEWKREVLKHPQVAALLKEVTAASKNQQQQTPKSSMNIDHPLEQVTFASNDMSSQPKRRPGRPAGCMNMSKMTMLSQLGTTMQSPTRKRGGPLGVKDKKRRYPYGSTKTMTKTDTTQTKRAYMGSKAKLSSSKRVRFAIERPDGDNAQVPRSTSCNNAIALPAFWYPFKHQLKYPSSIPILTLSGTQHPPEHFYSSPFLCHPILQSQHR